MSDLRKRKQILPDLLQLFNESILKMKFKLSNWLNWHCRALSPRLLLILLIAFCSICSTCLLLLINGTL